MICNSSIKQVDLYCVDWLWVFPYKNTENRKNCNYRVNAYFSCKLVA